MTKLFKVIVAGGRNFKDYELLRDKLRIILTNKIKNCIVVSGGARGADKLGEVFAAHHNLEVERFPADWDNLEVEPCVVKYTKVGKAYNAVAGHNRNQEMAEYGDALVAFDTGGRGTIDMIRRMKKLSKPVRVIDCKT